MMRSDVDTWGNVKVGLHKFLSVFEEMIIQYEADGDSLWIYLSAVDFNTERTSLKASITPTSNDKTLCVISIRQVTYRWC